MKTAPGAAGQDGRRDAKRQALETAVAIAQIASALAVVISLAYVANEFRLSRTLTSTDVQGIVYERMLELDRLLIQEEGLADLVVRAEEAPESLSPTATLRFLAYEHIFYDSWEIAWTAHGEGVLEEEAWLDWNGWFTDEARRRPRVGWTGNRRNHGEESVRFVGERLGAE